MGTVSTRDGTADGYRSARAVVTLNGEAVLRPETRAHSGVHQAFQSFVGSQVTTERSVAKRRKAKTLSVHDHRDVYQQPTSRAVVGRLNVDTRDCRRGPNRRP